MSGDIVLPDWVIALVGRLTLENEVLRHQLTVTQPQAAPTEPEEPT